MKKTILAPMTGTAITLAEVPDPIFVEKILGDGIAIIPEDGKIVSPVDGVVSKVAETGHAYGFTTEDGVEVMVHVGLETVALNGACFQIHVKEGDKVKQGQIIGKVGPKYVYGVAGNKYTDSTRKTNKWSNNRLSSSYRI